MSIFCLKNLFNAFSSSKFWILDTPTCLYVCVCINVFIVHLFYSQLIHFYYGLYFLFFFVLLFFIIFTSRKNLIFSLIIFQRLPQMEQLHQIHQTTMAQQTLYGHLLIRWIYPMMVTLWIIHFTIVRLISFQWTIPRSTHT